MYGLRGNLPLMFDFYIVVKAKSITKAAEQYSITQPALSRNVKLLEESLGLALINRSNKGISLTKDGLELYERLDEIFSKFEDKRNNVLNNADFEGKLIIGTTRNIADNKLSTFLTKFSKTYPKVNITLITDSASNLNNLLINHKIDVLFDYIPNANFTEKDSIVIKEIGYFNTCFACSTEFYNKYSRKIRHLSDLNNYDLVIPGSSRRRQILDQLLMVEHIDLKPRILMPDSKLMADFVKENQCIGYFIEEEVKLYGLVCLDLNIEMPKNHIAIIYNKNTINEVTKKFIDIVLENDSKWGQIW